MHQFRCCQYIPCSLAAVHPPSTVQSQQARVGYAYLLRNIRKCKCLPTPTRHGSPVRDEIHRTFAWPAWPAWPAWHPGRPARPDATANLARRAEPRPWVCGMDSGCARDLKTCATAHHCPNLPSPTASMNCGGNRGGRQQEIELRQECRSLILFVFNFILPVLADFYCTVYGMHKEGAAEHSGD